MCGAPEVETAQSRLFPRLIRARTQGLETSFAPLNTCPSHTNVLCYRKFVLAQRFLVRGLVATWQAEHYTRVSTSDRESPELSGLRFALAI